MQRRIEKRWIEICGEPETWIGNCYAVACMAVDAELVEGIPVYGHWLGQVAKGTFFYDRHKELPFITHGWIRSSIAIIDPTRWAFCGVAPEIFWSPLDDPRYDEGGNRWRKEMERPCPEFNLMDKTVEPVGLPQPIWDMIEGREDKITIKQACWLGNLSLITLGDFAKPVYESLQKAHLKAIVPLDNWRKVMGREKEDYNGQT